MSARVTKIRKPEGRNAFIENYLESYRKSVGTDFAVLIKGAWGCGKTHFIKSYCSCIKRKEAEDAAYWYVSLNGLSTVDEINSALFQLAHPILGSKAGRLAGKLLKGALATGVKLTTGISLGSNENGESKGSKGVEIEFSIDKVLDAFVPDRHTKAGARLLIFDDFERSKIPEDVFLGYLSGFVDEGVKVIVIAADDIKAHSKMADNDGYTEKVIGKTFEIRNNLPDLFGVILSEQECPLAYKSINASRDVITRRLSSYDSGKCNYRALKHSFRDLNYVFELIEPVLLKRAEFHAFSEELASWFVPLSYVAHVGDVGIEEFRFKGFGLEDESSACKLDEILNKFGESDRSRALQNRLGLSVEMLRKLIWNRAVTSEELRSDILNSNEFYKAPEMPEWCRYWHWFLLEDKDATAIEKKILKGIESRKYKHPGEIAHIFCVLLSHVKAGIADMTEEQGVALLKKYVEDVVSDGSLIRFDMRKCCGCYNGCAWWDFEFDGALKFSTLDVIKIVSDAARKVIVKDLNDSDLADIAKAKKAPRVIFDILSRKIFGESIFDKISVEDFLSIFNGLSNAEKHKLLLKMQNRWHNIAPIIDEREKPFLEALLKEARTWVTEHDKDRKKCSYDCYRRLISYFEESYKEMTNRMRAVRGLNNIAH